MSDFWQPQAESSTTQSHDDSQKEDPGNEFADEVWRTISRILSYPRWRGHSFLQGPGAL
jgi:hypothetical protein